ncbi:MAG: HAMP domain-containing protein [Gemmatimonadetes bacterium]|nr:HAMP domain-containing protein [Gemmatimonadota bacterium]
MKITPPTLSTRIAVPSGFFALISVTLLSFILIRAQREQVLGEVVHGSEGIAEAILLGLDHDMRANRREGVRELIETMGGHGGIDGIRLFSRDGRISYSSRPEEVGRTVDTGAEPCLQCHSGATPPPAQLDPRHRSRIYTDRAGKRLLATIRVIPNREGCQGSGCHLSVAQQSVLGVLDVAMSLEPAHARLGAATRNAVFISLAAVALITGTLFLLIRFSVRRPINAMVAATRRVATGDASLPVPWGTAREIGILAGTFNEMIESLASSKQRLEKWAGSLEEKLAVKAEQLREAQFQVVQAEKLSSAGLVAAGIAHELNSPLMAIITFAELLKPSLPADSQAQEDVRMIEREARRCAAIIRQLLDFARKQAEEPELYPCRIGAVLKSALELLKVEVQNTGVAVSVDVADDLPEVDANEPQLMQVFVNLILNALQAMPRGGRLRIAADLVQRGAYARLDLPPSPSSTLLRIAVRDSGTGIPRQHLTRIFDPFFTTKPVGQGSGLGLAVSLGLVRGFRGTIVANSDGESWSEFTILLPVHEQPALVVNP